MKKLRFAVAMLLIAALVISLTSCTIISPQRMRVVKGTYKLTNYSYTPSHERVEGRTPTTYDYVNDEKYMYEDYLVITGTGAGYYAHRDASGDVYVKEVTLGYEYNQEDNSKIDYVTYNDSTTVGNTSGVNRLGVTRGALNYSIMAIDYPQPFTGKQMRTESLSISWEKVDRATDLSYVKKQLGEPKIYDRNAFARRGIYMQDGILDAESGNYLESPYQYYFIVIDTADGVTSAEICYATKESPKVQVKETVAFSLSESCDSMTIGSDIWTIDPFGGNYFTTERDGTTVRMSLTGRSITDSALESLVNSYLPETQE